MKRYILGFAALLLLHAAHIEGAVVVDPDAFPAGTAINTAFPGVRLGAGGTTPEDAYVFSVTPSPHGASTGTRVFGWHRGSTYGEEWQATRADLFVHLTLPANFVSVDFAPAFTDYDRGWLQAYDSSGSLLDEVIVAGGTKGSYQTMSISRPSFDISRVTMHGYYYESVLLDNFQYNPVPEPSSVILWALLVPFGVAIGWRRKKRGT